jgi:uncharacterized protein
MKPSKYNRFCVAEDGAVIAFNALTGSLATLEQKMFEVAEHILRAPDGYQLVNEEEENLKKSLFKGGFLVEDRFDELEFYKVRSRTERFQSTTAGITIALTSKCNFRCPYCFEDVENGVTAGGEVEEGIAQFVLKKIDGGLQNLNVTWFGGEPLLTLGAVERLARRFHERATEKGCKYSSNIVTNGWLLTPKVAKRLKDCHVDSLQITIDGPADIHDKRRMLAGGKGSFEKIIANIKATCDILPTAIRVNVDMGNSRRIRELLERFDREGLREKLVIYFAPVEEYTETYKDTCGSCMHMSDFAHLDVSLKRTMMEMGFGPPSPPRPRFSFCTADKSNSVVIGPGGELYSCYTHIGNESESVGTVFSGVGVSQTLLKWLGWDPLEKTDCAQCEVLPLCGGGCLVEGFKEDLAKKGACETYKFALDDYLRLYYDSRKDAAVAQQAAVAGALPVEVTGGGSLLLSANLKRGSDAAEPLTTPQSRPQPQPKLFQIQGRKSAAFDQRKISRLLDESDHETVSV